MTKTLADMKNMMSFIALIAKLVTILSYPNTFLLEENIVLLICSCGAEFKNQTWTVEMKDPVLLCHSTPSSKELASIC
ncbi:unnamed protein product [Arctogadus glacialis]